MLFELLVLFALICLPLLLLLLLLLLLTFSSVAFCLCCLFSSLFFPIIVCLFDVVLAQLLFGDVIVLAFAQLLLCCFLCSACACFAPCFL